MVGFSGRSHQAKIGAPSDGDIGEQSKSRKKEPTGMADLFANQCVLECLLHAVLLTATNVHQPRGTEPGKPSTGLLARDTQLSDTLHAGSRAARAVLH